MTSSTANYNKAWLPDDFGKLLIATASTMSVAMQITNVVNTDGNVFRIPTITAEAATAWYAENADIALTDPTAGEEVVTPRKAAGLSKISNELMNDSTPAAKEEIGKSLARSLATGIDAALFGTADGTGVPPKGIGAFADAAVTLTASIGSWANVDPFIGAQFKLEAIGARVTSFIANPADAEILAKLKKATGSNEPLLATDATSPTTRRISGVPLWTSLAIPTGTIYGIDGTRVHTVLRNDVEVEEDKSVYFGSYSTAVRSVARVAFGYPHPKAIARLRLTV